MGSEEEDDETDLESKLVFYDSNEIDSDEEEAFEYDYIESDDADYISEC